MDRVAKSVNYTKSLSSLYSTVINFQKPQVLSKWLDGRRRAEGFTISALVLALAFSMIFSGGLGWVVLLLFPISLITVSAGFIFHELAHRYVARRFRCFAEYRIWPLGLLLALCLSFFGFVFAAPGAVVVRPRIDLWGRGLGSRRRSTDSFHWLDPSRTFPWPPLFSSYTYDFRWPYFSIGAGINSWLAFSTYCPFRLLMGARCSCGVRRFG